MPIEIGARLGPYAIQSIVGAGGMGEVYRARDTRLDRTVAIKVLPAHLSTDARLRERFAREARAISSLSHPNICTLHDIGQDNGVDFLVMEYLEGETLADRCSRGSLSLREGLPVAIQIADALDKAHRSGLTHRDLKPGNIMLTKAGAKLLDFGLARTAPARPVATATAAPPSRVALTEEGAIVGTLQYMAPEQIASGTADAASDLWALGCVLYEMFAGRAAFEGTSQAAVIAAIMTAEPKRVSSLPQALDRLIRHCLVKDPQRRWQSAFDVVLELEAIAASASEPVPDVSAKRTRRLGSAAAAIVAVAAIGVTAAWLDLDGVARIPEVRFEIPPPPGAEFVLQNVENIPLAVSPDGSTFAFIAVGADRVSRIWMRPVAAAEAEPLPGTEGATSIAWSPDGRSLAFFGGGKLQRLDLPNGAPVTICDVARGVGFAGSWGSEGEILFAPVTGDAIYRVAATGGSAQRILEPDRARREARIGWPRFLPQGRGFLYLARTDAPQMSLMWAQPGIAPRAVAPIGSRFELIEPDRLVFVEDGALLSQRIDFETGRLVGSPVRIAPAVGYFFSSGWAGFATSRGGSLIFSTKDTSSRFLWVDRGGRPGGEVSKRGEYLDLALSPDARSLVTARTQQETGTYDVWLMDLERNVETRLTSSPDADFGANWLPDGKGIIYSNVRGYAPKMISRNLVTGEESVLLPNDLFQEPSDVSSDGRRVAYLERSRGGGFQAWTLQLQGDPRPAALFNTDSGQSDVRFSPDGAYVALLSDESGEFEAYVVSLANPSDKARLSQHGARYLRWRRDGREILFLTPAGEMISVAVQTRPTLELGMPTTLFALPEGTRWSGFDVTRDGQRLLALELVTPGGAQPVSVILNWVPPGDP